MGRLSRPTIYLVLIGSAILVAVGMGVFLADRSPERTEKGFSVPDDAPSTFEKREIYLYFGDSQGKYLTAESRVVDQPSDAVAFCRRILAALLLGPRQGGIPVLPQGVEIRALHIMGDGVAFIDFESEAFKSHPGGVESELLSIYSIVNTLVLNVDGIRSVKFLIGGKEAATLAGHVDLSHPFEADLLRVR